MKVDINNSLEKAFKLEPKYYTPSMEEFCIGFECYMQTSWGFIKGTWPEILFEDSLMGDFAQKDLIEATKKSEIKIKHLDKEDIEDLGCEVLTLDSGTEDEWHYIKYKGKVIFGWEPEETIQNIETGGEWFTIKNKTELKKLMKQLNIL